MIYESYVQALMRLINQGKITVDDIKQQEYKEVILLRLETQ